MKFHENWECLRSLQLPSCWIRFVWSVNWTSFDPVHRNKAFAVCIASCKSTSSFYLHLIEKTCLNWTEMFVVWKSKLYKSIKGANVCFQTIWRHAVKTIHWTIPQCKIILLKNSLWGLKLILVVYEIKFLPLSTEIGEKIRELLPQSI